MRQRASMISCPACRNDTYSKREPRYEGFKKVGETLSCVDCGHVFEDEESAPVARNPAVTVFSDDDRPKQVQVFDDGEQAEICRYCEHYVLNPFTQRCDLHNRETEATDTCEDFDRKEESDGLPAEGEDQRL